MAVLDELPGLEAQIIFNRTPVKEYDDDEEGVVDKTVTKYIEAESGAEFGVRLHFHSMFNVSARHSVLVEVYLDGKYGNSIVLRKEKQLAVRDTVWYDILSATEVEAGRYFERSFCFSKLNTDDSDVHTANDALKEELKNVGLISVQLYWVTAHGPSRPLEESVSEVSDIGTVPEKALKGSSVSHQTCLAARKSTAVVNTVSLDYLYDKFPFATFNFKYRSMDALKSLLIIPRSPSPVLFEERDVDDLTPAEMRARLVQFERERKEAEAAARIVKQEGMKRERTRDRSETADGEGSFVDNDEVSFVSAKRRKLPPVTIDEDGVETFDLT